MKTKNQKLRKLARNSRQKLFLAFREALRDIENVGFHPNIKCISFNNSVSNYACCVITSGVISVSIYHVLFSSKNALRSTFMHELVHLCGAHGHGKLFYNIANLIMYYFPSYTIKRVGGSYKGSKPANIKLIKRTLPLI